MGFGSLNPSYGAEEAFSDRQSAISFQLISSTDLADSQDYFLCIIICANRCNLRKKSFAFELFPVFGLGYLALIDIWHQESA